MTPIDPDHSPLAVISRATLFTSFLKMGLLGFGGVLPWARRVIVDERKWLDDRAFAELIGLCQVLPGPNVVNLAVIIGSRAHGPLGSVIAVSGILLVPVALMLVIASGYASVAHAVAVRNAIAGASAAAAGLILGTAVRLLLHTRPPPRGLVIGGTAFVTVGVLQWPLLWVLVVLVAVGIAAEWRAGSPAQ
ncbi:MAG: chromate transporter [Betaproteobacteria bacterium]